MGWLIAAVIAFLLGCVPIGVSLAYNTQGTFAWLRIGPARIQLYPKNRRAEAKQKKSKKERFTEKKTAGKEPGGTLEDFLPIVKTVLEFLSEFRRRICVSNLYMKLILSDDDPCDLALNYGRGWAILGNLIPQLERVFVIKQRNLEVACDFTATKTLLIARADFTVTIGSFLWICGKYGLRGYKHYLSIFKKLKAVQ